MSSTIWQIIGSALPSLKMFAVHQVMQTPMAALTLLIRRCWSSVMGDDLVIVRFPFCRRLPNTLLAPGLLLEYYSGESGELTLTPGSPLTLDEHGNGDRTAAETRELSIISEL